MKKYLLPQYGKFYKANLHCHTTVSDGRLSPVEVRELYKKNGYSIVAYTDHDIFLPHHELSDESFLALSGFEVEINEDNIYPGSADKKCCHICFIARKEDAAIQPCWNPYYAYIGNSRSYHNKVKYDESKPVYVRNYSSEGINALIKAVRSEDFFVTYNHPTWSQENYSDYSKYKGMHAMEILNYSCEVMGYPAYVPTIYDDMLKSGNRIFAVAADDNHNKYAEGDPLCDSCGGFVMIKADSLSYEAVTDALFAGNFYASSGPEIYDLYVEDGSIHVACSDAQRIFMNTGHRKVESVAAKSGNYLNEAVFSIDDEGVYVRITVMDERGGFSATSAYFVADIL